MKNVMSRYKYSTKKQNTRHFSVDNLRGRKIGHESNLTEALSCCVREDSAKEASRGLLSQSS